jgi:hypothetical protein
VAGEEQDSRTENDEWADPIANYLALKNLSEVSVMEVLTDNQFLQMRPGEVSQREQNRAARVLRGLQYVRFQKREADGRRVWRYRKT